MITTLNKQNNTEGILTVSITESDYLSKVNEKVKEYSHKASIKGFRQGKVPAGIIKKMFGKSILSEEINHVVSRGVSDYIKENKLRILGEPLPNMEKAQQIDWELQKDFEFEFQIGLVEDFSVDISAKVKVVSHPIEVDKKVIDETIADVKNRFGKVTHSEISEATDNLYGNIVAKEEEKNEEAKKSSFIAIAKVKKKEQPLLIGKKIGDVIEFEIENLVKDATEKAKILNVSEEEAKDTKGTYVFTVTSVSHVEEATLDQALFDQLFGKDVVKSEEEFVDKIKETISENYQRETDHLLDHEIRHYYVDHTPINMSNDFLKTWLKVTSNGEFTDEILEREFNRYKESLKWDLIKDKISEDKNITVEGEEVREKAKFFITEQFGGVAIAAQLGSKLDEIVNNYLSGKDGKGENYLRIYNQLRHEKIMAEIKANITIEEKKVSLEEFQKIVESHQH